MTNLLRHGHHAGAPASGPGTVAPDVNVSMEGRIWFAQMLRGVAALLVVYYHLAELYWKDNAFTSRSLDLPPLGLHKPLPWHTHLTSVFGHNRLELGDLGVALFFLISGFVIPFSLAKVGAVKFLVRRIFRIYPTYMICLSLSVLMLMINCQVTGTALGISLPTYWANIFLMRDVFHHDSIDSVSWTLMVELKFYVLCALLVALRPLSDWRLLVVLALVLCVAGHFLKNTTGFLSDLNWYIPYLTFMFIGTCFYNLIQHGWSPMIFGMTVATLAACFVADVSTLCAKQWETRMYHAYPAALAIFSLAYYFREKLTPHPWLDFMAQVSYPLYVVHSVIGFSLMYYLYKLHQMPFLNFLEATAVVMFLAWIIHLFIEVPSNRFGHDLTRNWSLRAAFSPAPLRT